jgi:DNA-binding MurR/RpiR family transcriptional regulator
LPELEDDTVLERLKRELAGLSGREARAARHLLANYPVAGLTTVADFADQSGVSTATILRLVKRLGFPIYADFQGALRRHLEQTLQSPLIRFATLEGERTEAGGSFLERFLGSAAEQTRVMRENAASLNEEFDRVVTLFCDGKRDVHVLGGRYSSSVATYFGDLLASVRGKVHIISGQTQKWPQHLLDMGRSSILFVLDVRRYQQDVIEFAQAADQRGATIVLLTDQWRSPAAQVADYVLTIPVDSPSVFDVLAPGMVMAEALVGAIAGRLGAIGRDRMALLEDLRAPFAPHEAKFNTRKSSRRDSQ